MDGGRVGLLTLIVSLEAIFLSAFVMLGQNRESQAAAARPDTGQESPVVRPGRDHTGAATRCRTRPMADLTRNAAAISITP
jgi:hypothetical protein